MLQNIYVQYKPTDKQHMWVITDEQDTPWDDACEALWEVSKINSSLSGSDMCGQGSFMDEFLFEVGRA